MFFHGDGFYVNAPQYYIYACIDFSCSCGRNLMCGEVINEASGIGTSVGLVNVVMDLQVS